MATSLMATVDEPPAFPVDDTTLDLLWVAIHPGPDAERSSLGDLLTMLGDVHEHQVISALIAEVRRLREPSAPRRPT